jgi:glutamine synthetase
LGSGKLLQIECRLPGANCNVYLAFAAALASGLDGIQNKIEPPPSLEGNIYFAKDLLTVPRSLVNLLCMNFEASYTCKFVLSTFEN